MGGNELGDSLPTILQLSLTDGMSQMNKKQKEELLVIELIESMNDIKKKEYICTEAITGVLLNILQYHPLSMDTFHIWNTIFTLLLLSNPFIYSLHHKFISSIQQLFEISKKDSQFNLLSSSFSYLFKYILSTTEEESHSPNSSSRSSPTSTSCSTSHRLRLSQSLSMSNSSDIYVFYISEISKQIQLLGNNDCMFINLLLIQLIDTINDDRIDIIPVQVIIDLLSSFSKYLIHFYQNLQNISFMENILEFLQALLIDSKLSFVLSQNHIQIWDSFYDILDCYYSYSNTIPSSTSTSSSNSSNPSTSASSASTSSLPTVNAITKSAKYHLSNPIVSSSPFLQHSPNNTSSQSGLFSSSSAIHTNQPIHPAMNHSYQGKNQYHHHNYSQSNYYCFSNILKLKQFIVYYRRKNKSSKLFFIELCFQRLLKSPGKETIESCLELLSDYEAANYFIEHCNGHEIIIELLIKNQNKSPMIGESTTNTGGAKEEELNDLLLSAIYSSIVKAQIINYSSVIQMENLNPLSRVIYCTTGKSLLSKSTINTVEPYEISCKFIYPVIIYSICVSISLDFNQQLPKSIEIYQRTNKRSIIEYMNEFQFYNNHSIHSNNGQFRFELPGLGRTCKFIRIIIYSNGHSMQLNNLMLLGQTLLSTKIINKNQYPIGGPSSYFNQYNSIYNNYIHRQQIERELSEELQEHQEKRMKKKNLAGSKGNDKNSKERKNEEEEEDDEEESEKIKYLRNNLKRNSFILHNKQLTLNDGLTILQKLIVTSKQNEDSNIKNLMKIQLSKQSFIDLLVKLLNSPLLSNNLNLLISFSMIDSMIGNKLVEYILELPNKSELHAVLIQSLCTLSTDSIQTKKQRIILLNDFIFNHLDQIDVIHFMNALSISLSLITCSTIPISKERMIQLYSQLLNSPNTSVLYKYCLKLLCIFLKYNSSFYQYILTHNHIVDKNKFIYESIRDNLHELYIISQLANCSTECATLLLESNLFINVYDYFQCLLTDPINPPQSSGGPSSSSIPSQQPPISNPSGSSIPSGIPSSSSIPSKSRSSSISPSISPSTSISSTSIINNLNFNDIQSPKRITVSSNSLATPSNTGINTSMPVGSQSSSNQSNGKDNGMNFLGTNNNPSQSTSNSTSSSSGSGIASFLPSVIASVTSGKKKKNQIKTGNLLKTNNVGSGGNNSGNNTPTSSKISSGMNSHHHTASPYYPSSPSISDNNTNQPTITLRNDSPTLLSTKRRKSDRREKMNISPNSSSKYIMTDTGPVTGQQFNVKKLSIPRKLPRKLSIPDMLLTPSSIINDDSFIPSINDANNHQNSFNRQEKPSSSPSSSLLPTIQLIQSKYNNSLAMNQLTPKQQYYYYQQQHYHHHGSVNAPWSGYNNNGIPFMTHGSNTSISINDNSRLSVDNILKSRKLSTNKLIGRSSLHPGVGSTMELELSKPLIFLIYFYIDISYHDKIKQWGSKTLIPFIVSILPHKTVKVQHLLIDLLSSYCNNHFDSQLIVCNLLENLLNCQFIQQFENQFDYLLELVIHICKIKDEISVCLVPRMNENHILNNSILNQTSNSLLSNQSTNKPLFFNPSSSSDMIKQQNQQISFEFMKEMVDYSKNGFQLMNSMIISKQNQGLRSLVYPKAVQLPFMIDIEITEVSSDQYTSNNFFIGFLGNKQNVSLDKLFTGYTTRAIGNTGYSISYSGEYIYSLGSTFYTHQPVPNFQIGDVIRCSMDSNGLISFYYNGTHITCDNHQIFNLDIQSIPDFYFGISIYNLSMAFTVKPVISSQEILSSTQSYLPVNLSNQYSSSSSSIGSSNPLNFNSNSSNHLSNASNHLSSSTSNASSNGNINTNLPSAGGISSSSNNLNTNSSNAPPSSSSSSTSNTNSNASGGGSSVPIRKNLRTKANSKFPNDISALSYHRCHNIYRLPSNLQLYEFCIQFLPITLINQQQNRFSNSSQSSSSAFYPSNQMPGSTNPSGAPTSLTNSINGTSNNVQQIYFSLPRKPEDKLSLTTSLNELYNQQKSNSSILNPPELIDIEYYYDKPSNLDIQKEIQQAKQVQLPNINYSVFKLFAQNSQLLPFIELLERIIKLLENNHCYSRLSEISQFVYDLLLYLQIPGYIHVFINHKNSMNILFKVSHWLIKLLRKYYINDKSDYRQPKLSITDEQLTYLLEDCLIQLLQLPNSELIIKNCRMSIIDNYILHRVLIQMSIIENIPCRQPDLYEKYFTVGGAAGGSGGSKSILEKQKNQKEKLFSSKKKPTKSYWAKGTGYSTGNDSTHSKETQWNHSEFIKQQQKKSAQLSQLFTIITAYVTLPKTVAKSGKLKKVNNLQKMLPNELSMLLVGSAIIPITENYFRNDSLLDALKFSQLYHSIFGFLRALCKHKILLSTFFSRSNLTLEYLKRMNDNAIIMKEKLSKNITATDDVMEQTEFIESICSTYTTLLSSLVKIKPELVTEVENPSIKESNLLKSKEIQLKKDYTKLLTQLQFDEVPNIHTYYHYKTNVKENLLSNETKQRLLSEISSIGNNLPFHWSSSVFLRLDSSNLNVMQVLITGPLKTPYANGCFLFDVFCGARYPNGPPLVNLQTTGYGTVRFNPNLYNCGKVCLSLLGTWQGSENEQWNRETSTLLQVFVSIQGLIFVEHPYFNEPSYEKWIGTPIGWVNSKIYNENIKPETVRYGMLEMIRNPPKGFEEVIKLHFTLKYREIMKQLAKWERDQVNKKAALRSAIVELREELNKL